jgi:hypothetical protein
MPEHHFDVEDLGIDAQPCVRCGQDFAGTAFDAALVAQLMGREVPEGHRGRAICHDCMESDELRAMEKAKRAQTDS